MKNKLSALLVLGVVLCALFANGREKPNVLFILADDLGWGDVGFHNPEMYSPNLDRLADQALELTQHYVAPQCTPTRVSFLTGRYAQRFGPQAIIAGYNVQAIPYGTPTIASLLKEQGYDTALIGKWHLGSVPGQHPNLWGFDYSYGSLGGAVGLYDHRYRLGKRIYANTWHRNGVLISGFENGQPYEEGTHVTDLITKDAVRFIEKDRSEPFFLYLAYTAVHTPLAEEKKWFNDPAGKIAKIEDESRRLMAASVNHLDHGVGEVIKALENSGKLDNTIIVFSSDNGGVVSGHKGGGYAEPNPQLKAGYSSNGTLRSGKTHVYEGGIRVPTLVSWPGVPGQRKIDVPVHICDWLPTLGTVAGIRFPEELDGRDIMPVIKGGSSEPRTFYWGRGKKFPWDRRAVRHGNWKLVKEKSDWELYDVAADPQETSDLKGKYPETVKRLLDVYEQEAAGDEHRWMLSVWIGGPASIKKETDAEFKLTFSRRMHITEKDLIVSGGDIIRVKNEGTTALVTVRPIGQSSISLQVKQGVYKTEDGVLNQPSNVFMSKVKTD